MVKVLDPQTAWMEAGDPDDAVRSRYTGYPLSNGEMVITILSWDSSSVGHQLITFEWRDNHASGPIRMHKLFHLFPEDMPEGFGGWMGITASTRTGKIFRGRPDEMIDKSEGEAVSAQSQDHRITTGKSKVFYRSWAVDFDSGYKAFEEAKTDWRKPPDFNFVGMRGGYSCASWARKIAAVAGIESDSVMAEIGYPVPIWEIDKGAELRTEEEMWVSRKRKD